MSFADYIPHRVRLGDGSWARVHVVRAADGSRVRVLEVGGVYQSATYLDERWAEPVFEYYRAFDAVFEVAPEAQRVLMIGGGGYAWPKHVLEERPGVELSVVELEPAITEAAKRWFFLERAIVEHPGRLELIEGDGRAYLERCASEAASAAAGAAGESPRWDAIVIDAFAGKEPVRSLATLEAARLARSCLAPRGVLAANVVSTGAGSDVSFLRDMVATWREVFANVAVMATEDDPFALEDNYLLMASDKSLSLNNMIAYDSSFVGNVLF